MSVIRHVGFKAGTTDLVKMLEDMIELAKRDGIHSFYVVTVQGDDHATMTGHFAKNHFELVGAVELSLDEYKAKWSRGDFSE